MWSNGGVTSITNSGRCVQIEDILLIESIDYVFIYIKTNLINGKQYIGQKNLNRGHRCYLGSGTLLLRAIKKHGRENFSQDIIETCSSKEEMDEREIYWISYYDAVNDDNFYNLCNGGNTTTGYKATEEVRQKQSIRQIGRKWSEESKKKMSNTNKGHVVTEETRAKIRAGNIGEKNARYGKPMPEEIRRKISESTKGEKGNMYGKHHTIETIDKISKSKLGSKHTEETKKKMSESRKGRKFSEESIRKRSKGISQYDLDGNFIQNWESDAVFCRLHGKCRGTISACCKGKRQTAHGFKWTYANN